MKSILVKNDLNKNNLSVNLCSSEFSVSKTLTAIIT